MSEVGSADGDTPVDPASQQAVRYAGLATRAIAFAVDEVLITLVAVIVAGAAALIVAILHLPKNVQTVLAAIGAGAYVLWSIGYFVAFWSTTGQSPGARVMQIRVVSANGKPLKPRRALVRCIGAVLAALPLFLGYVGILFDSKRRGFMDRLARTLVVEAPQLSVIGKRQAKLKALQDAARQAPGAAHIVLVGMMGSGKTTVGRLLADRLGRRFWDNDEALEQATGRTAAEIQQAGGQAELHRLEDRLLRDALDTSEPMVLAAAGSVVLDPVALNGTLAVWLRTSTAKETADIAQSGQHHRPLPADPAAALSRLGTEREPLYSRLADITIDVAGEPTSTCDRVMTALGARAEP